MNIFIENKRKYTFLRKRLLLKKINKHLNLKLESLVIHLLNDAGLLDINKTFLNHDFYTDIITFDLRDSLSSEAELYISIERIRDNAIKLKKTEEEELTRVLIHGMLHLAGYNDKTNKDKIEIKKQEDYFLNLLFHVKK